MSRFFLNMLSDELEKQLDRASKIASQNKKLADLTMKETADSWSSGGDREYSQSQAKIAEDNLRRLTSFKEKIDIAKKENAPASAIPVSYVTIKYDNVEEPACFYFVNEPVYLTGFRFVTVDSTLGKLIYGKKEGDKIKLEKTNQYGDVNASFEIKTIE